MEPNAVQDQPQPPANPQPNPSKSSARSITVIVILILVVTGMIVSSKYLVKKPDSGATGNVAGKAAPDFVLTSIDGKPVKLSDYKGKAVVLNFWATWCAPCKIEIPWFEELQKQYGPQGLEIVGVNMDDNPTIDSIGKFARSQNIDYTVLLGNDKVADLYGGVEALPTTFYIGRDGKIVARAFGLISHKEIEANIQSALKTSGEVASK
ncbi:MAG: TlpA family protein disulfide reductase [Terriglobales bacterium]